LISDIIFNTQPTIIKNAEDSYSVAFSLINNGNTTEEIYGNLLVADELGLFAKTFPIANGLQVYQ
jgi:hypothetical protein